MQKTSMRFTMTLQSGVKAEEADNGAGAYVDGSYWVANVDIVVVTEICISRCTNRG